MDLTILPEPSQFTGHRKQETLEMYLVNASTHSPGDAHQPDLLILPNKLPRCGPMGC